VDTCQSGRSLQIRVNNHDFALVLLFASLVQYCRYGISKLNSTSSSLLRTSNQELGALSRLDSAQDVGALGVPFVEV
jgi:hypothetical protein